MNTPVSFKLAKLIKEKGFDKKCNSFYDLISNIEINDAPLGNYNLTKQSISIPTVVDVVMWLYEKHGIWIVSDAVGDKNIYPKWNYKIVDLTNPNSNIDWELNQLTVSYEEIIKNSYDSPTEAYEAAIEYCLTKLI